MFKYPPGHGGVEQTCKKSRPVQPAVAGNFHILGKFGEILHFPIRKLLLFFAFFGEISILEIPVVGNFSLFAGLIVGSN